MKKNSIAISVALTLITLSWSAFAQDVRTTPGLTFDTVPSLCKPCVFYGGDTNGNDPNANAFTNGNTLLLPNQAIYAAVDVPKNVHGVITGILFMTMATQSGNIFDPATAPYDIRTGVSGGNAGKSVATGTGPLSYAPYGQVFGYTLYETAVNLTKPFTVTPGTRYWFNLQPQCTDSSNSTCSELQFFLGNTTQETNGLNAGAQPPYEMFGGTFGDPQGNVCGGDDTPACARASFGLMGHH